MVHQESKRMQKALLGECPLSVSAEGGSSAVNRRLHCMTAVFGDPRHEFEFQDLQGKSSAKFLTS